MNDTQYIDNPWGASVFGAASVDAAPDLARIRVAVNQTCPTPAEAFEGTRSAVNRVREVLRGHAIPDAAVSASRLNLTTDYKFINNERKFRGYTCNASFVIEVRALETLETVLVDVVAAGANQVDGVDFDVSGKKQLRARAREGAVAAAREKAELYASAAGVRLGQVIHIRDIDSESMTNVFRGHGGSMGGNGDGDNLTPGRITVSAGVLVGFSLAP